MDIIGDIEMIGLVIVEETKPINKIGIRMIVGWPRFPSRISPTRPSFGLGPEESGHRNKRHALWSDRSDR
jgi:hypothetical protein